ncbi:hypothetical protein A1F94_013551 [Pyrenophora tritici-repentis]|uniref:Uncharacterized protein n=3 Tax=Pyrenophora tritici-repentis TaxID=45151 RepID=A0A922N239_9PLEO|nr:uncharacterized protein PTRG_11760 [Pyrenophora tritici-repentis Pt-1C-BFP]EDU44810.1 predicted protein [Pyrenophora tritici-repentis Pt-1C-BFP]KAG9375807.1 hypothetical protein A1F94_013551 [Pyrenophora tritici-repentis]KAI1507560.1 hypothetical protein Ptr86124_013494 [Pyrenophora tritici-repentis]KAI1685722.1 hypothetical protein KJE20_03687 [Pyrenophora tritici-repentis]
MPSVGRVALPFGTNQTMRYHAHTLGEELRTLEIDVDMHSDNISRVLLDTVSVVGAIFEAHYKMLAAMYQPTKSDSILYKIALPEGIIDGDAPYLSAETVGLDCGTVPTVLVDEEPFLTAMQELALSGDVMLLVTHLEQQRTFYHQAVRALFRLNEFKVHWNLRLVNLSNPEIVRQIRIGLGFLALNLVLCPSNTQLSVYLVVASEEAKAMSGILEVSEIEQESEYERMLFTLLHHWHLRLHNDKPLCSEKRNTVSFPGYHATLNARLSLTIVSA